ncbi:unnamed protein product [Rotaria sordida]|uniref:Uncharacterized protein n=2 Tax=Rotaria sordida TaxID=392033 RepID=A0A813U7Y9_9BILA|nr:unnamed protein product [Rotaria sordida]CAF0934126.1 unnamed protein product [Rotaria sordida]CAF3595278.1 unnamed protein product [Rotaria sordida]
MILTPSLPPDHQQQQHVCFLPMMENSSGTRPPDDHSFMHPPHHLMHLSGDQPRPPSQSIRSDDSLFNSILNDLKIPPSSNSTVNDKQPLGD